MDQMTQIKDTSANPAPLGLLAFGMTTVLLNFHNAGYYGLTTMILGMGIFYGGLAQVIVGIMEWKKGNTFGTVAFTSYGLFWLSLVALIVMPLLKMGTAVDQTGFATYFIMWGIFTSLLFVGTLRLNRALQVVFGSLAILFFMLAFKTANPDNVTFGHITGYEGIFVGASAIYAGMAQVWNEVYGRVVLPLGIMKKK